MVSIYRLVSMCSKVIESSCLGAVASCGTHVIVKQRASFIYQVEDQSGSVPVCACVKVSLCTL